MTGRFDHRDPGTAERAWAEGPLPAAQLLVPPGPTDRLLVVAAHPDDESLGAGGLVAQAHRRSATVTVLIATDGEASHPQSPTHTPAQLATIRRQEVQKAVAALAPGTAVHFLGLPDGALQRHMAALTAQLEYFARVCTHIVSPWRGDRHPDHEACAQASATVAAQHGLAHWQYPVWAWHWADPGDASALPWARMRRLPLSDTDRAAKARALRCHRSQHAALSDQPGDEPILGPAMLAHFERPEEVFVLEADDASSPSYFEALYARSEDPWGLGARFYEQRKRALLLSALPRRRFRRAFEPGCATGLLTEQLAQRCDEVLAWDVAQRAVSQAAARLPQAPHVRVAAGTIPADWPEGEFDLVVLSEVGYYCVELGQLVKRVASCLAGDGVLVACHWRHPAPDHPHTAEAVHGALGEGLLPVVRHVEDDFLLDVWSRSGRSVAATEGILA